MDHSPLWPWYRAFRRNVICRLGFHGKRYANLPGVPPANFCEWCSHAFNPVAFQPWIVTLKTGETFEVEAINAYHAGSVVMYGAAVAVDGRTGKAIGEPRVHRDNIASAVLKNAVTLQEQSC